MKNQTKEHWDSVYNSKEIDELGWYEETPKASLDLIDVCNIGKEGVILDVGVGASMLIDNLIEREYKNIIAMDISEIALMKLKERLGEEKSSSVKFVVDDITKPEHLQNIKNISIWHDRAVLHFLTEESERKAYLDILLQLVNNGGYVIIAAFSLEGAQKCSGLNVRRYDEKMLQEFLGSDFKLLDHFNYVYHMPLGETRQYIYTLFKRVGKDKRR